MPMPYGLPGFAQTPPSPPLPRIGGGAVVPGSTGGSMTTTTAATVYRPQIEDQKLTKDAMERYMRERNDMVIVILHAKVVLNRHKNLYIVKIKPNLLCIGSPKIVWQREAFLLPSTMHLPVWKRLATPSRGHVTQGRKRARLAIVCFHWNRKLRSGYAATGPK